MATKKTDPSTSESPAKKVAVKKVAAKKVAAVKKVAAKKTAAKKSAPKASLDLIARAAYLNYRRRVEQGLPGDSHGDWVEAENQFSELS
jgi:hypothetical protein